MLRRLTIIAIACTLAACTNDSFDPTGVSFSRGVDDDRTTVPPGFCDDTAVEPDYSIIPPCVDEAQWPINLFDIRSRHDYEGVGVVRTRLGAALKDKSRLF
jgi:hypothetical protein